LQSRPLIRWPEARAAFAAGTAVALISSALTVAAATHYYETRSRTVGTRRAPLETLSGTSQGSLGEPSDVVGGRENRRQLPEDAAVTILTASFPIPPSDASRDAIRSLTTRLEATGFRVFYAEADLGPRGRWQRILAGAYSDRDGARRDIDRLKVAVPSIDPRIVRAAFATGMASAASKSGEAIARSSGTEP
jgi:hypothetical protein